MKSGITLIAEERKEQINIHGFDVTKDAMYYKRRELVRAALYCLTLSERHYPKSWESWFKKNIARKTLELKPVQFDIEMCKIAGALLAAEIDRLQSLNPQP